MVEGVWNHGKCVHGKGLQEFCARCFFGLVNSGVRALKTCPRCGWRHRPGVCPR